MNAEFLHLMNQFIITLSLTIWETLTSTNIISFSVMLSVWSCGLSDDVRELFGISCRVTISENFNSEE